jgi:hypothetical protein
MNIKKSLTLLKVNALKADFKVAVLVVQKLIKQKDVKPISSQPKNNIIILPDKTKNNILITNDKINNKNLSTKGSYLKYEKAYIKTKSAIVVVKNAKLKEIVSTKK